MHKRALVAWILLLAALIGLLWLKFTDIGDKTKARYRDFKEKVLTQPVDDSVSSQEKEGVSKELFILQGDETLHARLTAVSSKLLLAKKGSSASEEMSQVELYSQEAFEGDNQIVRVVLAKKAIYHLKDDHLAASDVTIYRFRLPGHALPAIFPKIEPLMEGKAAFAELYIREHSIDLLAKDVHLLEREGNASLSSDSLTFDGALAYLAGNVVLEHPMGKAIAEKGELVYEKGGASHGIKEAILTTDVHFYRPDGSFLSCEEAIFRGDEETLVCPCPASLTRIDPVKESSHTLFAPGGIRVDHKLKTSRFFRSADEQIHFVDALGEMFADEGIVHYKDKGLEHMEMAGKVFLAHSRPEEEDRSYAYADRITYDPKTKEMVMEGDRVLVYDRVNKMEVSANKLRIRRDEATSKERIKGEGDVRFKLDEKEFEVLKDRFKLER